MTENQKTTPHATGSTRQNGAPAVSDRQSLTVGSEGPIVLHDTHLVETHQHFNRMNIPERRPHAKGSGAFGEFEVTEDVSKYTKALVFQPGAKTETLLRFSTVAGELGSRTPGATCAASRCASTRTRATSTWSATTPRSSSCATP